MDFWEDHGRPTVSQKHNGTPTVLDCSSEQTRNIIASGIEVASSPDRLPAAPVDTMRDHNQQKQSAEEKEDQQHLHSI
jgi:hypothetical protein